MRRMIVRLMGSMVMVVVVVVVVVEMVVTDCHHLRPQTGQKERHHYLGSPACCNNQLFPVILDLTTNIK